jgi:branched-chain amino acid transport system permease protein
LVLAYPRIEIDGGRLDAVANAGVYVVLALGLNIVVGFAGLLDLGYAAFFAIGAYTYGILSSTQLSPAWTSAWQPLVWAGQVTRVAQGSGLPDVVQFNFSFWLMLPVCGLVAAAFGLLFGVPTLRLSGDYVAIVTLGFGEIVPVVIRQASGLTNGAQGLVGVNSPTLFGYSFGTNVRPYYYLIVAAALMVIWVSDRLKHSRIGRGWQAIREDQLAAECMGVSAVKVKLLAFALGAGFAGIVGEVYVAKLGTASPTFFEFPTSVAVLSMVVLGGMASIPGVLVGAIILSVMQSFGLLSITEGINWLGATAHIPFLEHFDLVQSIQLIYGLVLVLMMMFRRQGLWPVYPRTRNLREDEIRVTPQRIAVAAPASGRPQHSSPSGASARPLLQVLELEKHFGGVAAVTGVSLSVHAGEIVGIIGPNGSGKTTLFNLLTGILRPDRGSVMLSGDDITGLPSHRIAELGIARTFQNIRVFSTMTVLDNVLVSQHCRTRADAIAITLHLPSVRREERRAKEVALQTIARFGIRLMPRLDLAAGSLSYANRRRLEIARALATQPQLLLLDEPTAGMNPAETLELMDQIRALRDTGLTVLLIEHKLNVVNQISDRVLVLDHGAVIAEGTPQAVYNNAEVLAAYLGRTTTGV